MVTAEMEALCFVRCVAGEGSCTNEGSDAPMATVSGMVDVSFPNSEMKKLCADASGDNAGMAANLLLPGASPEQRAEVHVVAGNMLGIWCYL